MSASDLKAARTILDRLVAFDTTSRNSNLALIAWVENYLAERGVASVRVNAPEGTKANLFAVVGPQVEGGVVLSGHTDVVPVDGQAWTSDPWTVSERDGRLYGRGVADMKSFVALALAAVDAARAAALRRPLILAFSYDEEVGCLGAPSLIAEMEKAVPRPSAVIVGEPTSLRVVSAHKGIATFVVTVEGKEAHSSQVRDGASAIMAAVPIMSLIAEMGAEAATMAGDPLFDPPHPTMTIGLVAGGSAVNILARSCEFVWDLRCPPGIDPDRFVGRVAHAVAAADAALKRVSPTAGASMRWRSSTPAMSVQRDSEAERLARSLTGDNGVHAASFAAEAGLFQRAGWPTVICGPGSIEQAHQPDEWIDCAQIGRGAAFMDDLIRRLAAPL